MHSHATFDWILVIDIFFPPYVHMLPWILPIIRIPSFHCVHISSADVTPKMHPLSSTVHSCCWGSELPLHRPQSDKNFFSLQYETVLAPARATVVSFWIHWPDLKRLAMSNIKFLLMQYYYLGEFRILKALGTTFEICGKFCCQFVNIS